MPPPITYKTVVGTYTAPNGDPVAGSVRFVPLATVLDPSDNEVIPPLPVTEVLDGAGYFEAQLMCTDVAGTAPTGWAWSLDEDFAGGRKGFVFSLPTAGASTVDLADVLPASSVDVTYAYASQASISSLQARVTAIEAFDFTAYQLHPYLLMGS